MWKGLSKFFSELRPTVGMYHKVLHMCVRWLHIITLCSSVINWIFFFCLNKVKNNILEFCCFARYCFLSLSHLICSPKILHNRADVSVLLSILFLSAQVFPSKLLSVLTAPSFQQTPRGSAEEVELGIQTDVCSSLSDAVTSARRVCPSVPPTGYFEFYSLYF